MTQIVQRYVKFLGIKNGGKLNFPGDPNIGKILKVQVGGVGRFYCQVLLPENMRKLYLFEDEVEIVPLVFDEKDYL